MGNRNTTEWKELLSVCSNFSNAIILFFKSPSYSDVYCFHGPFMLILKCNEYRGMSLSVCSSLSLLLCLTLLTISDLMTSSRSRTSQTPRRAPARCCQASPGSSPGSTQSQNPSTPPTSPQVRKIVREAELMGTIEYIAWLCQIFNQNSSKKMSFYEIPSFGNNEYY